MTRNKYLDFLILMFLYIAAISIPFSYFIKNPILIVVIQMVVKIGFIVFAYFYAGKHDLLQWPVKRNENIKYFLFCFIIIFNNLIILYLNKDTLIFSYNKYLPLQVVSTILTAFCEELIFRKFFFDNLEYYSPLKAILINSVIFGIAHIGGFLSSFSPVDLTQVVYATGLGAIFSIMYYYTSNFWLNFAAHFLYNFMNTDFYSLFHGLITNISFYVVSISVAAIVALYLIIIYQTKLSKL